MRMADETALYSANANTSSFSEASDEAASIPMPSDNDISRKTDNTGEETSQVDAWQRAQAALKKITPSTPSAPSTSAGPGWGTDPQSYQDMQAYMMHYYPWMARTNFNPPYQSPQPFQPTNEASNPYMNPYFFYGRPVRPLRQATPPYGFRPSGPQPQHPRLPPISPVRPVAPRLSPPSFERPSRPPVRPSFPQQSPKNNFLNRGSLGNNTAPIRFNIGRPPAAEPSTPIGGNALQKAAIPDNVRRYVERAYMALEKKEDRNKLEEYLKKKLNPLLASGAAKTVDWDKEPLPSEVNFELKAEWTPVNELRKAANVVAREVTVGSWQNASKNGHNFPVRSPSRKKEKKRHARSRSRHGPSDRSSSSDEVRIIKVARKEPKKQKKRRKSGGKAKWTVDERSDSRREERARRFAHDEDSARRIRQSEMRRRLEQDTYATETPKVVVGTSADIEKPFFRLTAAPDPSMVRPFRILDRALKLVQRKYAENHDYRYANDQLKSIRQDLMIQCIRTEFTVSVYETNARIAIENSDREEFNQCQSQLKLLYSEIPNCPNEFEFTSYRLLYYIAAANTIDQATLLHELKDEARRDLCVAYALRVREAWALTNYVRLFRLYGEAPRMASYVMDLFIDRERKTALISFLKSYRPSISVSALMKKLSMTENDLCEWLEKLGIKVQNGVLDCRLHSNSLG